ncbi:MAG: hypothetical protein AMJ43_09640 [Coxiella sp. DG_40]|nr:MAG: hypothetical protein AMJ43_09640 [Coxiella sp. DG_40]
MIDFLAAIITWINVPVNALGKLLLAPVGVLPGWLSNTIISAVAGIVLLAIFKYTSNQQAIGRVRDDIKANMLALKLFKDSIKVTLQSEGRVFRGAGLLLLHSIRPMLVMIIPVSLLLSQMGLWYRFRPLLRGEETLITMKLNDNITSPWPNINIEPLSAFGVMTGPVRLVVKQEICWKIRARENGYHRIVFQVDERRIEKELAIGNSFMRLSAKRPGWHWADILWHPAEKPFGPDSVVQSISIDYPGRSSQFFGIPLWLIYFFIASLVFALLFKPFLKVRI